MPRCYFLALSLVFAEIAFCLGKKTSAKPEGKTTATSADCDNKPDAKIYTVYAKVNCGVNLFPVFMPQRCRIYKKDSEDKPTKKVKVTLNAGETSILMRAIRCEYSIQGVQFGRGTLKLLEDGTAKASIGFSECAHLSKADWVDKGAYAFYCDKSPFPPVIPASCDFGETLGIYPAGFRGGNSDEKVDCDFSFKDASITPYSSKMKYGADLAYLSGISNTDGIFSDTPWHI